MLPRACRLLESNTGLALHDEAIEVLRNQDRNGLGDRPYDAHFNIGKIVKNTEGSILKDRIGI